MICTIDAMDFIVASLIYLVVPLAGLKFYLFLCQRMKDREIPSPPIVPLFLIFATYGGWLTVLLTTVFGAWSGMATLGLAYLVLLAPVLMLILAFLLFRQRKLSSYHYSTFVSSSAYFVLLGLIWLGRKI
jgi:hypothetical protein